MAACGSICGYSISSRDRDPHCRAVDSTSPHGFFEWLVQFSVLENRPYFQFDSAKKCNFGFENPDLTVFMLLNYWTITAAKSST